MAEGPVTAWDSPTWVLAVMHYPAEPVLLERIARRQDVMYRGDNERARMAEAARQGKVAGNVLTALYALAASPWRIAEPSFARAVHIAVKLAREDDNGAPQGAVNGGQEPPNFGVGPRF